MRLFVALEIPAVVRDNLAAFIKDMRELSEQLAEKRVRWVRPENLHVTLKFIGEVADAKLDGIRAALSTVHVEAPLDIRFRGLGFFPDENRPTVLWTGLETPTNLQTLAGDIDRALATQGIAREKRAFVPHLTLARLVQPFLHEKLRAAIQKNCECEFGSAQACEFHLIESKLKPSGAEYTSLASSSSRWRPSARWPS
ncbi:MAG: RNA 2',3'-cyclic phosphodiesterase [Candidatus Acidiferrum sp.]